MLFKEGFTDVSKHQLGNALIELSNPQVKDLMRLCLFKSLKIKFLDIVEREVVHFLDVTEFRNDKIENCASNGHTEVM
jgi:hypothetical protein